MTRNNGDWNGPGYSPQDSPEHQYYPDLPCWCGGMPFFGIPHRDQKEKEDKEDAAVVES